MVATQSTDAPAFDVHLAVVSARMIIKEIDDLDATEREAWRTVRRTREASAARRLELGRLLLAARAQWPSSGPKAKGWGEFLASVGINQQRAWDYMHPKEDESARDPVAEDMSGADDDRLPSTRRVDAKALCVEACEIAAQLISILDESIDLRTYADRIDAIRKSVS